MRSVSVMAIGTLLCLSAFAQAPPKNAVDITNLPATAARAEANGGISSTSNAIRVYVGNLSGADATAIQGLLTQALFESKQVVITQNQGNANLILQGRVLRRPLAKPQASEVKGKKHHPTRKPASDLTDPTVVKDLESLQADGQMGAANPLLAANGTEADNNLNSLSLLSSGMGMDNPDEDLSQYQFRLYLQLFNPDGDLVWMSGEGPQAASFGTASQAVSATIAPMLTAIAGLPKVAESNQP